MTSRREELVAAAKQLQADKDKSLDALIIATDAPAIAEEQLAAAKRAEALRVRDALKAGWTEKELTTIGFDLGGSAKPARKPRGTKNTPPARAQAAGQSPANPADATT